MIQSTAAKDTSALCGWAAGLHWSDIPAAVQGRFPARLLDTAGLALVGATTAAGKAVTATASPQSEPQESTVAGSNARSPASIAALINGTLAHCRDFDDTHPQSLVHPGSVVIPTALAIAESSGADNEDFAAAIVAGYEVAARMGLVAGKGLMARGFHATSVIGPVAAAVTASRLMRLDSGQMASAIGLACSMSGGLMAFMNDGSWSKWLHAGWAAQGGIQAAVLARSGFRGPVDALLGKNGLYDAFVGHDSSRQASALREGFGDEWHEASVLFKYYPCAHVIQPYIDTAASIVNDNGIDLNDIAAVTCDMAPFAAHVIALPREAKLKVATEMDAISSLPFLLAAHLLDGEVTLKTLSADSRSRQDIHTLAQKIIHRTNDSLTTGFDGLVEVRIHSGRIYSLAALDQANDDARVLKKFEANLAFANPRNEIASYRLGQRVLGDALPDWHVVRDILATSLET